MSSTIMPTHTGTAEHEHDPESPFCLSIRRRIIAKIQVILEEKLNEPERYEHLIHNLAKRVEYVIYRDARSFDSYANVTTLRNRVKHSLWEMKRTMLAGRRMACTRKSKPKIRARAA